MATFTTLGDDDIARLAAAFSLGAVRQWRAIEAGTINSNFVVDTATGRAFLRVNEGKTEADVRYEAELVAALADAGVSTPRALVATDGRPFAEHDGKLVSAFPWVAGEHRCAATVTETDAADVGAAVATLHLAGAGLAERFERAGIYTFDHIVERFESFRHLDDPALADVIPLLADETAWLGARADVRAAATRGVIHGDLFRDNALHGDRLYLLDFEQASTGSFAYDLAVTINAWCYAEAFSPALIAAMVRGYESVRPLTGADRAALPVECRAAAMRFAVTRITDIHLADTVSTKDFRRYEARLRAWRDAGDALLAG